MIHHYTSIDTLQKIITNRSLRFRRLDQMDDIHEEQWQGGLNWGRRLFASCWTCLPVESIDQWRGFGPYANGVRISVEESPFFWHLVHLNSPGLQIHYIWVPCTKEFMLSKGIMLVPSSDLPASIGGPVSYVPDVSAIYRPFIKGDFDTSGLTVRTTVQNPARHKINHWAWQKEYRFIVHVEQGPDALYAEGFDCQPTRDYTDQLIHAFQKNKEQGWPGYFDTHIDWPINMDMIQSGFVTAGPLMTDQEFNQVSKMMQDLVPAMGLQRSRFTGAMRR
tara:strand:- start:186157 stop:186987 length:831 start_codon:yes stop_codon:yes gene_type:complete